jgi:hypothetical protein
LVFSKNSSFSIQDKVGSMGGAACTLLNSPKSPKSSSSLSTIDTEGAGGGGIRDGNAKGVSS